MKGMQCQKINKRKVDNSQKVKKKPLKMKFSEKDHKEGIDFHTKSTVVAGNSGSTSLSATTNAA